MKYRVFPAGTIGVLVAVAAACAMPQREFVSLCRDGSLSEVSLALQSGDVSAIQPAGGVSSGECRIHREDPLPRRCRFRRCRR